MKRSLLLTACIFLGSLYSQKLRCRDIQQMRSITQNAEKFMGEYTGEDDYVHFHHFNSQIVPAFGFHAYFEVDSAHDATSDSVYQTVMFTCFLDTFLSKGGGANAYKNLKGVVKACLGAKFEYHQYKEDPLQLWCYSKTGLEDWVMGMKYEHPFGNVLFIETSSTIRIKRE